LPDVLITEFTDPGCPWAYSAEPFRRRLTWLYGDTLAWEVRMVGLAESPQEYEERGFDTRAQAEAYRRISLEHGMPIDTRERPRMAATLPACRAVVAARRRAPEKMRLLLQRWMAEPETEAELREDLAFARRPMPAARVLDHKLANWSGGRRYTCPSYEMVRLADGVRIAIPGFQPFHVYDVITANLVPGLGRRETPESVEEVLSWAGTPLASKEVAVLCDVTLEEARERLGRVADEQHVGFDGFWSLNGARA
jgi:hypothetical protein